VSNWDDDFRAIGLIADEVKDLALAEKARRRAIRIDVGNLPLKKTAELISKTSAALRTNSTPAETQLVLHDDSLPVAQVLVPWRTRLYHRLPRRLRRWGHLMRNIFNGRCRAITYIVKDITPGKNKTTVTLKCQCGKTFL